MSVVTEASAIGLAIRRAVSRRDALAEYLWVVSGAVAATVGTFVGVRVLTAQVAPAAYGELALAMTVSSMATQLVFGPISSGIGRFYASSQQDGTLREYLRASRVLVWRWGLVFSVVTLIGSAAVAAQGKSGAIYLLLGLGFVFAFISGHLSFLAALQSAARQRRDVAVFQSTFQAGRYFVALAMVLLFKPTSAAMLGGFAIWATGVLFAQQWRIRTTLGTQSGAVAPLRAERVDDWIARVEAYARPMLLWGVFTMLQGSADRWALGLFTGTKQVGLYAVLFQLSFVPIGLVFGTVSQFLGPILCERVGDGSDPERIARANRWIDRITVLSLFGTGAMALLGAWVPASVIRIVVAPAYREAMGWLPLGILAAGIYSAGQFVSIRGMILPTTRSLVVPKIGSACVGALCMVLGAALKGVPGVLLGWLVFSVVQLVWIYLATWSTLQTTTVVESTVPR